MNTAAAGGDGVWVQTAALFVGTPAKFHTGDEFRLFPTRIEYYALRFAWLFVLTTAFAFSVASPWIGKVAAGFFAVTPFPSMAYFLTQGTFAVACLLVAHWGDCIPGAFRVLLQNAETQVS